MAFDLMDTLGNVASARVNQAMQPFTNTDAYATNRLYNAFGVQNPDQTGNVQPKSTTINYGDDGTHEVVNKYTVSPTDYSLTNRAPQAQPQAPMGPQAQQPGAGLGAGFAQYLAPQAQQPQAQPQTQPQQQQLTVCACCNSSPATKLCGKCRKTRYCSSDCQLKHWANHKTSCRL
jgi:hypothetical protein